MSGPPPLTPERARIWGTYADNSPFYQHLNEVVAGDDLLLGVLNEMEHLPRQNVLFAGVQYLMLRDGGGPLAEFYPNFSDNPHDVAGVDGPFRLFVLEHAEELIEIGRTRYTQTNECRRCVSLLPGVWATPAERFHLIDFGTSAGLNLHIDRYHYRWDVVTWGPPDSIVRLDTEIRGAPVAPRDIEVLSRTGLDLSPLDPTDADARLWLEALIWPEHHERRQRLLAALDLAAANPPDLIAGDALQTLGAAIDRCGEDPVVVINSFILNQFSSADRVLYDEILDAGRGVRPVYRVSMEWLDSEAEGADLAVDDGSGLRKIALAHPHGEWLELFETP